MRRIIESKILRKIYFDLQKRIYKSENFITKFTLQHYIYSEIRRAVKRPPRVVHVENTNFCNAECIICPNSKMTRTRGVMSDEDFNYLIDQIVEIGTKKIFLQAVGEPLMDSRFVEKIVRAKSANIQTITTSNGALLNESLAKDIMLAGLDEIHFSLDAYDKERYETIRKNLDRDRVYNNVLMFIKLREKLGCNTVIKIRAVSFRVNDSDRDDLRKFESFWKNYPVTLQISNLHNWGNSVDLNIHGESIHGRSVLNNYPCDYLWYEPLVTHTLELLPCCHDFDGELNLGSLKERSFHDIWYNNESLDRERFRHLFKREERSAPCNRCEITPAWLIRSIVK